MTLPKDPNARATAPGRFFVFNGGFLNWRIRRILALAGHPITFGRPGPGDRIAVWGHSPTATRGEAMAERTGAALVRVEDAFLRSVLPGRAGAPPLGLMLDSRGMHYDSHTPSDLEHLLATHPLDDTALLTRARDGIDRLRRAHLSKYNAFAPKAQVPVPGYVLVIDQTQGDASLRFGEPQPPRFREMLAFAEIEHPGARILIKAHPETMAGHRAGHYAGALPDRAELLTDPVSPWHLLEGAVAVYTVSSQLGFEAILAGHKPRVFGQPWYAGWGLTQDESPVARRTRTLTRAQLFAAAMILAPIWYDPNRDRLCSFEEAVDHLEAAARAWREDHQGHVAVGMSSWKRPALRRFFGAGPLKFTTVDKVEATTGPVLSWASRTPDTLDAATARAHRPLKRVEDGFLRSRGLGANLVPPSSLAIDDLGIYYDPHSESRLERWISESVSLPPHALRRAERLIAHLQEAGVTKYNTGSATLPALPDGPRILVPGQVEDDASIRLGCGEIRTNLALLEATRRANPEAILLYKPHPDVEAGLRPGAIPKAEVTRLADVVLHDIAPATALAQVQAVWTMTSGLGFEALLRGVPVTTLGAPFYAGWGLTTDLGQIPVRREARPTLAALVHATLIDYPRYFDARSGLPCPVEVIVDRLQSDDGPSASPGLRLLSKIQGWAAPLAPWWRRPL